MLVTETPPQTKWRETELVPPGGDHYSLVVGFLKSFPTSTLQITFYILQQQPASFQENTADWRDN